MTEANAAPMIAETLFPALARAVVLSPADLQSIVKHATGSSTVAVRPPKGEAGNLIGKLGRTFKAFELLSKLVGDKHRWPITYAVEVEPGENPPPASKPRIKVNYRWDESTTAALLRSTLSSFLHYPADVTATSFEHHTGFEIVLHQDEPVSRAEMFYGYPSTIVPGQQPKDEQHRATGDDAVAIALSVIFGSIGRIGGTKCVTTLLRRSPAPEEAQPATAAGRYAGELR